MNAVSKAVLLIMGTYGLWQCVPGFRPKHIRDIIAGFFTLKGIGIFIYFFAISLLMPAARRLKNLGFFSTILGSLFVLFGFLEACDFLIALVSESKYLPLWSLRVLYLGLVAWGFADVQNLKQIWPSLVLKLKLLSSGLNSRKWQVFLGLVLFFLIRQQMHLYLPRLAVFGDEVSWWQTGAKEIMNHGLVWTMAHHNYGYYTPGIPWLISFPARLIGTHREEWMWGFPLFAMTTYGILLLELAQTAWGFLCGWTLLFYIFLASRDLLHMFGSFFYGEAIASALVGILASHFYLLWQRLQKGEPVIQWRTFTGLGFFLSLCLLAKPPIGTLAPLMAMAVSALVLLKVRPVGKAFSYSLILMLSTNFTHKVWQSVLSKMGHAPEYSISWEALKKSGVDLNPVFGMIRGLFMFGTFQNSYTMALIAAVVILLAQKQYKVLKTLGITIFIYWGAIFGLYATLWQHGDLGSCGRYLAHAGVGCMLLMPLAFPAKSREKV